MHANYGMQCCTETESEPLPFRSLLKEACLICNRIPWQQLDEMTSGKFHAFKELTSHKS